MDKKVVLFVRCCSPDPASLKLQEELLNDFAGRTDITWLAPSRWLVLAWMLS